MRMIAFAIAVSAAGLSAAVSAQSSEADYPVGSLGTDAILVGNYELAERQLRSSYVSKYDPARALNLGTVLMKTGRTDQAMKQFRRVLLEDDIDLELADGRTVSSHKAARHALANIGQ
jgi:Flp pilus assembly protein TadD